MDETSIGNHGHTTSLLPCHLTTTNHIIGDVITLTAYIDEKFAAHELAGIVWTTNDTQRMPDVRSASFGDSRTYKIRLWQAIDSDSVDPTLAHGFRWVSDVDAVELAFTKGITSAASEGSEPKPVSGWFHKVSYLQHESTAGDDADPVLETPSAQTDKSKENAATKQMTAVKSIHEEDKCGNTAVVDQLSTRE